MAVLDMDVRDVDVTGTENEEQYTGDDQICLHADVLSVVADGWRESSVEVTKPTGIF